MHRLFPAFPGWVPSVGLLAVRIVIGIAMMHHGYPKIQNPTGWMPPEAPVPGALQAMAAVAEFGGGFCWVIGFVTPLASFLMACTMAVATYMHFSQGDPFVSMTGGMSYELALGYFSVSLLLLLAGPGRFSLDALLFRKTEATASS